MPITPRKGAFPELVVCWLALAAVFLAAPPVFAQAAAADSAEATSQYAEVQKWVDADAAAQTESLGEVAERLKALRESRDGWQAGIKAYKIKLTNYSALLLLPRSEARNLDRAWMELRETIAGIEEKRGRTQGDVDEVAGQLEETRQQITVRRDQLTNLEAIARKDGDETAGALTKKLKKLLDRLTEKENLLKSIQGVYADRLAELESVGSELNDLAGRFQQHLKQSDQEEIYLREKRPPAASALAQLASETKTLAQEIAGMLSADYWVRESQELWKSAGLLTFSLLISLVVTLWILRRVRSFLARISGSDFCMRFRAHQLFCVLTWKSLLLAGATAFVYVCTRLDDLVLATPSLEVLLNLFLAWLMTKWALDALKNWDQLAVHPLDGKVRRRLRALLMAIRCFALAYAFLAWFFQPPSALLNLARFIFELLFIGLAVFLGRAYWSAYIEAGGTPPANARWRLKMAVPAALQAIAVGGFVADLAGFGNLATFWYLAWGQSAIVGLWWYIFFRMLGEWDDLYQEKKARTESGGQVAGTVQWMLIRLGQLAWGVSFIALMLLVWGRTQNTLAVVVDAMGRSIQVGNMNFSILGILYAVLALVATHGLASLWRHAFQTKFLKKSGFEPGLQDSITTISVYVVWGFGILVALHVFGLNTATLAVAFGALGIGLGFGLQNIFNNFISGIILLFERPIQVGDDVEINGMWATVKKINVRATVVQTYDNASLIIPNSEFISSQVTNWSFKDKRLRRKINVGVAYGSDVELVRQTLLEIAGSARHVLKFPRPDVLFADFGDSALIFVLRVWTDIDHMLEVETAIRFEIDRLFRERRIEIAFPQMDLHFKSPLETRGSGEPPAAPDAGTA